MAGRLVVPVGIFVPLLVVLACRDKAGDSADASRSLPPVFSLGPTSNTNWNVNAAAQAAGEYALRHPELLPDLDWLSAARQDLVEGLRRLGLRPLPTNCNFFLVPVGDACELRRKLLTKCCLVRDCASFGLPDHIRIAVRTAEDNVRLLAAFESVL